MSWLVDEGDSMDVLASCPSASVDALVTDPPAGIGFMGKDWDKDKGGAVLWIEHMSCIFEEARRVMKPGAHGLVWALPRTSHWTATALEIAGFEVRDVITHVFATGFPKSLNLGDGRGTALKPASEHWILVRAPCEGTTTANVERWGTGGLEIDACRIGTGGQLRWEKPRDMGYHGGSGAGAVAGLASDVGRWPANVIYSHAEECGDACVDGCPVRALDEQAGERKSAYPNNPDAAHRYRGTPVNENKVAFGDGIGKTAGASYSDSGGASRFFYCAKPSPTERDYGLDGFAVRTPAELTGREDGAAGRNSPRAGAGRNSGRRNTHPTVKSIALMRYLVRLVTPRGGLVLDPFCGSGSTGCAAVLEGAHFLGIEQSAEYAAIARARISAWAARAAQGPATTPGRAANAGARQGSGV